MNLSKSDFLQYLHCPQSLWLCKHEPERCPPGDFSLFLQKLVREGYEVERRVQQYFARQPQRNVTFQREFESAEGLFARVDVFEETADGKTILYEVKSSTTVKRDAAHDHVTDACFQKLCAERAGQSVDQVFLIHLNGAYVRRGEIDPSALLTFADVTAEVAAIADLTAGEMDQALALLRQVELNQRGCSCLYKPRSAHCDSFRLFNPDVPEQSIYSLPRLNARKRAALVDDGILELRSIPDDRALSNRQMKVVQAAKAGAPQIDRAAIKNFLAGISYPIHFLDYETFASAVPMLESTRPHQQFPVQFSLHLLHADGTLDHHEYLEQEARLPDRLLAQLQARIGSQGSVVAWHASFEKSCNRSMAASFPSFGEFLNDVNGRMVDLEDPFKDAWVDARFGGSSSIKNVLPVVCPALNYDELEVQDGGAAMDAWQRMVAADAEHAQQIGRALLKYCALDSLAMVEIYRVLTGVREDSIPDRADG